MTKLATVATIILLILIPISRQQQIFAQDMPTDAPSPSLSPIITMENKEIQYDLPYPGLLPDNPLYCLKIARDKIEEFLITDPGKKADFEMQQSDKRMNMSIYLSNEHPSKEDLIASTVSKGLNYFEQGVTQTQQAGKRGEDTKSFVAHMDIASQKYHQVIMQLQTKASSNLKGTLATEQTRLAGIRNMILRMEKNR